MRAHHVDPGTYKPEAQASEPAPKFTRLRSCASGLYFFRLVFLAGELTDPMQHLSCFPRKMPVQLFRFGTPLAL